MLGTRVPGSTFQNSSKCFFLAHIATDCCLLSQFTYTLICDHCFCTSGSARLTYSKGTISEPSGSTAKAPTTSLRADWNLSLPLSMRTSKISQDTSRIINASTTTVQRTTRSSLSRFAHGNPLSKNSDASSDALEDLEDVIPSSRKRKRDAPRIPIKRSPPKTVQSRFGSRRGWSRMKLGRWKYILRTTGQLFTLR
jgi:hypothetical protein